MTIDPIRVMVVDDNARVRYGLRVFIEVYEDLCLVGEASNGQEAVDLCGKLQPDLVLMDLVMPHMNGVKATEIISRHFPNVKVLILTSTVEIDFIQEAMTAGAQGYLLKNVGIDTLAQAIRSAVA